MLDTLEDKRELLKLLKSAEWSNKGMCPKCLSWPQSGHISTRVRITPHVLPRQVEILPCVMQYQIERLEREIAEVEKEKTCAYREPCGACNAKTFRELRIDLETFQQAIFAKARELSRRIEELERGKDE